MRVTTIIKITRNFNHMIISAPFGRRDLRQKISLYLRENGL